MSATTSDLPVSRPPLFFRYLAAAVCAFAVINEARELVTPGFSVAYILFYVPGVRFGADACIALLALLLAWSAFGPVRRRAVAAALASGLVGLATLGVLNAAVFYRLVYQGVLATSWPVPLSVVIAVYLVLHAVFCLRRRHLLARIDSAPASAPSASSPPSASSASSASSPPSALLSWAGPKAALMAALVALWLVVTFYVHSLGLTDYRRPADAIVVLGARVYANGRPSEALAERVLTAAALYRQGLSPRLIVSGGIGEGGHSEARVMRAIAREAGVPDEAIIEDERGSSTEATVKNLDAIAERHGIRRVLAVSHYHHLPRIKLLCTRRGLTCFTVPADEGETLLLRTPYYVLRETAALMWVYMKG
jgi:uncharacterized SAM-binding protein YcdF (DUF218 family)